MRLRAHRALKTAFARAPGALTNPPLIIQGGVEDGPGQKSGHGLGDLVGRAGEPEPHLVFVAPRHLDAEPASGDVLSPTAAD